MIRLCLVSLACALLLTAARCFAVEQEHGWGSSWTVPRSEEERAGRALADRLHKALRARDWPVVAKILDDAERANPNSAELQMARAEVAIIRQRYSEAAGYYGRALSLVPSADGAKLASYLYAQRAYAHSLAGQYSAARSDFERAIAANRNNLQAHNNYAWLLATCPDASVRDGRRAAEFARAASQRSGKQDPVILDTLAAAEAEMGDFRAAVRDEKRAIVGAKTHRDLYQQHLASYMANTAVRETPQAPTP